jgi:hypothetical protein
LKTLNKLRKTMAGRGGYMPGGGRPKGSLNKLNADIKGMIVGALEDVGGRAYLRDCAISHPVAFLGLVGKVLPLQIASQDGSAIGFDFQWASAAGDDARQALAHSPSATVTTIEPEALKPEQPLETQPQRVNPKRR